MAATWGRKNPEKVGTAAFYNEVLRTVSRLIGLDRMSALRIDVHQPLHLAAILPYFIATALLSVRLRIVTAFLL